MRTLRIRTIIALTVAVLIGSQGIGIATAAGSKFIVGPDRDDFSVATSLAVLDLPDGGSVDFVAIPGERNELAGVMVLQSTPAGKAGIDSIERLQGVNPAELYLALADREDELPAEMVKLYGNPDGQQGWARDELAAAGGSNGYLPPCPSWGVDDWNAALAYGKDHYNNSFVSTWDGPDLKPEHWHKAKSAPATGIIYRDLYGQANNVTGFSAAVVLCHTDSITTVGGVYAGNFINIKYRGAAVNNTWFSYHAGQLDEIGKVVSAQFHPSNALLPSAPLFDFRLEILSAELTDIFHIGATWQKPFGYQQNH